MTLSYCKSSEEARAKISERKEAAKEHKCKEEILTEFLSGHCTIMEHLIKNDGTYRFYLEGEKAPHWSNGVQ